MAAYMPVKFSGPPLPTGNYNYGRLVPAGLGPELAKKPPLFYQHGVRIRAPVLTQMAGDKVTAADILCSPRKSGFVADTPRVQAATRRTQPPTPASESEKLSSKAGTEPPPPTRNGAITDEGDIFEDEEESIPEGSKHIPLPKSSFTPRSVVQSKPNSVVMNSNVNKSRSNGFKVRVSVPKSTVNLGKLKSYSWTAGDQIKLPDVLYDRNYENTYFPKYNKARLSFAKVPPRKPLEFESSNSKRSDNGVNNLGFDKHFSDEDGEVIIATRRSNDMVSKSLDFNSLHLSNNDYEENLYSQVKQSMDYLRNPKDCEMKQVKSLNHMTYRVLSPIKKDVTDFNCPECYLEYMNSNRKSRINTPVSGRHHPDCSASTNASEFAEQASQEQRSRKKSVIQANNALNSSTLQDLSITGTRPETAEPPSRSSSKASRKLQSSTSLCADVESEEKSSATRRVLNIDLSSVGQCSEDC